jgi:hypothetical protein
MFANNGCQYVHCGLSAFHSGDIIQDACATIVHIPLTLIVGIVTIFSEAYLARKVTDSMIIDDCKCIASWFSKMHGLNWLTLRWRAFLEHSDDVINSIFAKKDDR